MARIMRVGVTFPPDLLKQLDETIAKMGYGSRSKAIQDSVRLFISEHKELLDQEGRRTGVVVMVYDHEAEGLEETLTNIQHKYSSAIRSSMHIHLSERDCLEAIAVEGDAGEITELIQELEARRGVKQVKSMIVSS
jgi:CopG family nickel-responsive transcriptional regulator